MKILPWGLAALVVVAACKTTSGVDTSLLTLEPDKVEVLSDGSDGVLIETPSPGEGSAR